MPTISSPARSVRIAKTADAHLAICFAGPQALRPCSAACFSLPICSGLFFVCFWIVFCLLGFLQIPRISRISSVVLVMSYRFLGVQGIPTES